MKTLNYLRNRHLLSSTKVLSHLNSSQNSFFIASPGPSLKNFESLRFNSKQCTLIAINYSYQAFQPDKWLRAYSYVSDEWRVEQLQGITFSKLWTKIRVLKIFSKSVWAESFLHEDETTWIRGLNVPPKPYLPIFSHNLLKGLYNTGGTSLFGAIQFAVWAGATKIYLLGSDFGIQDSLVTHGVRTPRSSHELSYSDLAWENKYKARICPALQRYKGILSAKGINIINLSIPTRDHVSAKWTISDARMCEKPKAHF